MILLTYLDLSKNELRNVVLQNLATDPISPTEGQMYYNTATKKARIYNGTDWENFGGGDVQEINASAPLTATEQPDGSLLLEILPASPIQDGSLSKEDKTKLDNATESNDANTLVQRNQDGEIQVSQVFVSSPSQPNSAANKSYVDALFQGFGSRNLARVVAVANVAITGLTTTEIDGVTLADGDKILLTEQTDRTQNGLYVYDSNGVWARAEGFEFGDFLKSNLVIVQEGNQFADKFFLCINDEGENRIGADDVEFVQFSGANEIEGGAAIVKQGNAFSLKFNTTQFRVNAQNELELIGEVVTKFSADVSSTATPTPVVHNLGTQLVDVSCFRASDFVRVYPEITPVDANTVSISSNPSESLKVVVQA